MDLPWEVPFMTGYVYGVLFNHVSTIVFAIFNVVLLGVIEFHNPGSISAGIERLARSFLLDQGSWAPPPSPNVSRMTGASAMLNSSPLWNSTAELMASSVRSIASAMPTSRNNRTAFELTCNMLEHVADTINVTRHVISDVAIYQEPAESPPAAAQTSGLIRILNGVTKIMYELIRLYDILWSKIPDRLFPFVWLAIYILGSWKIWCIIASFLRHCYKHIVHRMKQAQDDQPVPNTPIEDPALIPLPPSPQDSPETAVVRPVETESKIMVEMAVQLWRRLARVYRELFQDAEKNLRWEVMRKARKEEREAQSTLEVARLRIQVSELTSELMNKEKPDFRKIWAGRKNTVQIDALKTEITYLKRKNSIERENVSKLTHELANTNAMIEQLKKSLSETQDRNQTSPGASSKDNVDSAAESPLSPSNDYWTSPVYRPRTLGITRLARLAREQTARELAASVSQSPSPLKLGEDEQKQIRSDSPESQPAETVVESTAYAQKKYKATFPSGYVIIPTSGDRLLCGLYAMVNTIGHTCPEIVAPSVDDLHAITKTAVFLEQFKLLREMDENIDEYFHPEQLDFLIRSWAAQKNLQLRLGYIIEGEQGEPTASIVSAPEDKYQESIIWVHLDPTGIGHYSGVVPKATYPGYEPEKVVIAKDRLTSQVLNTANLMASTRWPSRRKAKIGMQGSTPDTSLESTQATMAQGDIKEVPAEKNVSKEESFKQAEPKEAGSAEEHTKEERPKKAESDETPITEGKREPVEPDSLGLVKDENRKSSGKSTTWHKDAERDSLAAPLVRMTKNPGASSKTHTLISKFDSMPELFSSSFSTQTAMPSHRSSFPVVGKDQIRTSTGIVQVKRKSDQQRAASLQIVRPSMTELVQSPTARGAENLKESDEVQEVQEVQGVKMEQSANAEEDNRVSAADVLVAKSPKTADELSQTAVKPQQPPAAKSEIDSFQQDTHEAEETTLRTSTTGAPTKAKEDEGSIITAATVGGDDAKDDAAISTKRVSFAFVPEGTSPTFLASPSSMPLRKKSLKIDTVDQQPKSTSVEPNSSKVATAATAPPQAAIATMKSAAAASSVPASGVTAAATGPPATQTVSPRAATSPFNTSPLDATPTATTESSEFRSSRALAPSPEMIPKPLKLSRLPKAKTTTSSITSNATSTTTTMTPPKTVASPTAPTNMSRTERRPRERGRKRERERGRKRPGHEQREEQEQKRQVGDTMFDEQDELHQTIEGLLK